MAKARIDFAVRLGLVITLWIATAVFAVVIVWHVWSVGLFGFPFPRARLSWLATFVGLAVWTGFATRDLFRSWKASDSE